MDSKVFNAIRGCLTDDLLKPGYTGHCYVASEAYYHIVGRDRGCKPYNGRVNGVSHWWLRCGKEIIDLTSDQFNCKINYSDKNFRCRGFLTKGPSKRAQVVIDRVMRTLGRDYW